MKCAEDFRHEALEALRGKWWTAVLTGFVASLIGAELLTANSGGNTGRSASSKTIFPQFSLSGFGGLLGAVIGLGVLVIVIWLIVTIVISGAGKLGYAIFNLKLIDGKDVSVSDLFSQFSRMGDGFCMNFLVGLYTALWSLLFVIPGLVKKFSYAMTPYILAEHSEMSVSDAITESRRIMDGNKWRLFCLQFSFIGWQLLCAAPIVLTLPAMMNVFSVGSRNIATIFMIFPGVIFTFIGFLFLRPYEEAAYAAFYRDICGCAADVVDVWAEQ